MLPVKALSNLAPYFNLDAGLPARTHVSPRLTPGNIDPFAFFTGFLACAGRLFCRKIN
jgi:hypothetical protein